MMTLGFDNRKKSGRSQGRNDEKCYHSSDAKKQLLTADQVSRIWKL